MAAQPASGSNDLKEYVPIEQTCETAKCRDCSMGLLHAQKRKKQGIQRREEAAGSTVLPCRQRENMQEIRHFSLQNTSAAVFAVMVKTRKAAERGWIAAAFLWVSNKAKVFSKSSNLFQIGVSVWMKAFNEVQTSEQTGCRENRN